MTLMVGFIGFNGGSSGRLDTIEDATTMALAVVNTMLGCGGGGLTVMYVFTIVPSLSPLFIFLFFFFFFVFFYN